MDLSKSLKNYLDELSSDSPTPGGGNVAAFSATLACSLGIMVCNLTIGKKKYLEVEEEIKNIKEKLENYKNCFIDFAQKDNYAFDQVMEAFKLPKETDEQKATRREKIEEATFAAAVVPSEVIETCKKVMPLLNVISVKGNKNSVSDAGVALSLLFTAAESALLNVIINCTSLSDQAVGNEFMKKSEVICEEIKGTVMQSVRNIKSGLLN